MMELAISYDESAVASRTVVAQILRLLMLA
jgi:hypothetical protein